MLRHLLTAASVLSLLLAVAIAALWVRSYFRWDKLGRDFSTPLRFDPEPGAKLNSQITHSIDLLSVTVINSFDGSIDVRRWVYLHKAGNGDPAPNRGFQRWAYWPDRRVEGSIYENLEVFAFSHFSNEHGSTLHIVMPHWALALLFSSLAIIWLKRRRARNSR